MCCLRLAFISFLWLHAVINTYIYLASTERKNTLWTSARGLLSFQCETSFQFVPKEKLLLSTVIGWRVLEKSSLDCSGDGNGLIFFIIIWTTVEVEYLDLDIADDIANISSSLPQSYASSSRSELWPVMLFISHFGNPKDFNFRTVFFLADWLVIFFVCVQFC